MRPILACLIVVLAAGATTPPWAQEFSTASAPFLNFESGPTEGLLLSPDGATLYALNTPDHRVEVYRTAPSLSDASPRQALQPSGTAGGAPGGGAGPVGGAPSAGGPGAPSMPGLRHVASIFTGLEPVSMALHPTNPDLLFVSNHVSDTVSVVDLTTHYVTATIDVGDEPQGLVVADGKLFVACARASQTPGTPGQTDPQPLVDHVVVVARASAPWDLLGHVELGAVKPRDVVAVDGTVYAIPLASGNHTVLMRENETVQLGLEQGVPDASEQPFALNPILQRPEFVPPAWVRGWFIPVAGRIVTDSEYPGLVPQLVDRDILPIDVATASLQTGGITTGVGTVLLDIECNPVTGQLWVVGTEARNRERFEPVLRGRAVQNRVTLADAGGDVTDVLELAPPFTAAEHAQPAYLEFSSGPDGDFAYVACLGTSSIVVLDAATGALVDEFDTGPLPMGLAADGERGRLYVFCKGDKTLRTYDIGNGHAPTGAPRFLPYDPEPPSVRAGRRHLYEARAAQGHGNGNSSCASCHVFGHYDHMAWDLGDPEGGFSYYYPDVMTDVAGFPGEIVVAPSVPILSPLKGPMVTQSLRGLMDPETKDDLPLHWRGDRRTIHTFRGAFASLLGGTGISPRDMQEFGTFLRSIRYAPNPRQPKDRVYVGQEAAGMVHYGLDPNQPGTPYASPDIDIVCATCHQADFTAGTDFTGSRPTVSAGSFTQLFNTAQLRMIYEKDFRSITGFGALHDGAVDGVRGFMDFTVPSSGNPPFSNFTTQIKDEVASFVKAWDHGLAPMVGGQFTLDVETAGSADAWLDLAESQAQAGNVDLVLKGYREDVDGSLLPRGALFGPDGQGGWGYQFDTGDLAGRSVLVAVAALGVLEFTFTAVPPGQGVRLGLDRDEDGAWDFLEVAGGTDPLRADTDGDGHADGAEPALGGDPRVYDRGLPDGNGPVITSARALEIFHSIATVSLGTDEPARVVVETGAAPGNYDGASAAPSGWRRVHDVIVEGLAPGTETFYRVTATDTSGNVGTHEGSFTTLPPFFHVEDITLQVSGVGPYVATATVRVHDHDGAPVTGFPVHAFWAGDIGGQPWEVDATTDGAGVATFTLQPFAPAGSTTVSFSPAYVGSGLRTDAQFGTFVGLGGDTPEFFYDNTANKAHYRSVSLP